YLPDLFAPLPELDDDDSDMESISVEQPDDADLNSVALISRRTRNQDNVETPSQAALGDRSIDREYKWLADRNNFTDLADS
ncbi:MAG: hypothetical protein Q9160_009207, partial [Pyrenula sp. 1 TL-2023]